MAALALRRSTLVFLATAALLSSARCGPYLISQQLRGSTGNDALYIYPPGSRPWSTVRVTQTRSGVCAGLPVSRQYFELHQRTTVGPRTLVLRDRGKLPPSRTDFDADVDALLADAACLTDGERASLKAKLWAHMPRTFEDDLLTRFGFDARRRRVDLQAGMRLRVEWASRIADVIIDNENSYVSTGTTWWLIGTRPKDGALGFEPAFGWGNAGPFMREARDVLAGSVDVDARGLSRSHYRLLYPADGFSHTRLGNDNALHHAVLLAADDENDFAALTDQYDQGNCDRLANPAAGLCTPFAARAVPVPEIEIELRGERTWVALGTTLRQLLEREGRTAGPRRDLHLLRVYGSEWRNVVVDDAATTADPHLLDLPLVKGDRITW